MHRNGGAARRTLLVTQCWHCAHDLSRVDSSCWLLIQELREQVFQQQGLEVHREVRSTVTLLGTATNTIAAKESRKNRNK